MNKGILAAAVLGIALLLSSGCPELGIENPIAEGNTLVVHNLLSSYTDNDGVVHERDISFLSIILVPDECSDDRPRGINLLPSAIPQEGTFVVDGLADGRYWCQTEEDRSGYVTLSGGNTTDWYVR